MNTIQRKILITMNGVEMPLMQKRQLNIYKEQQIKVTGGVDALSNVINYEKPQSWLTLDLTDREWNNLEQLLKGD